MKGKGREREEGREGGRRKGKEAGRKRRMRREQEGGKKGGRDEGREGEREGAGRRERGRRHFLGTREKGQLGATLLGQFLWGRWCSWMVVVLHSRVDVLTALWMC